MWHRFIECIHRTHCIHSVFIAYSIVNEAMLSCLPINNCSLYSSIMWHTLTHTHPHCPRPRLWSTGTPPSLHIFRLFTVCKTIDDYWLSDCPQPPQTQFPPSPTPRSVSWNWRTTGAWFIAKTDYREQQKHKKAEDKTWKIYKMYTQKTSRRTRERERKNNNRKIQKDSTETLKTNARR